ncbi:MICOS complex subunit MIC60 [Dyadobacter sp. NIV53]|uniref:MICOS complex subunit MIC60 n=1 Tax=Dyadobacter sp. NIV53 TaxID=2861765 RepID=UPI001E2F448A|nr:MICOS complex subunit MIC60 [Dyadobacter sp. NIV53]
MKTGFKIAFIVLLILPAFAQNKEEYTLLKNISRSKEDTNRVLAYIEYGRFLENGNLDSAAKYYLKASALSNKLNYDNGKFKFISNYTYILNLQGNLNRHYNSTRKAW